MKPLAKAAIKGGISLYEKTKGAIAETGEAIGDIVAEAKAEAAAEQAKKIAMAAGLVAATNPSQDNQDN
jgi:capsid protein